jgi:hypothetical protein
MKMWRRGQPIHTITVFYLVLLFWDVLIGINITINIRWLQNGAVVMGDACIAQGVESIYPASLLRILTLVFSGSETAQQHRRCDGNRGHVVVHFA